MLTLVKGDATSRLLTSGALRQAAVITEPDGAASFLILRR
jgi:hypothetical protein